MYREISKLILYGDMDKDCILYQFGEIFRHYENKTKDQAQLIQNIYTQVKRLLVVATDYGFDHNLWHNYLAFYLVTNENPFSITCEKVGANDGSVNHFAKNDFAVVIFQRLRKTLALIVFRSYPIIMPSRKRNSCIIKM